MIAIGKGMYGDCLKDMGVFFVFVSVCSFVFFFTFSQKKERKGFEIKERD